MNKFSNKQLDKMEQMLKAIHNPNFEAELKKAAESLNPGKTTEMDLVKQINSGNENDKC